MSRKYPKETRVFCPSLSGTVKNTSKISHHSSSQLENWTLQAGGFSSKKEQTKGLERYSLPGRCRPPATWRLSSREKAQAPKMPKTSERFSRARNNWAEKKYPKICKDVQKFILERAQESDYLFEKPLLFQVSLHWWNEAQRSIPPGHRSIQTSAASRYILKGQRTHFYQSSLRKIRTQTEMSTFYLPKKDLPQHWTQFNSCFKPLPHGKGGGSKVSVGPSASLSSCRCKTRTLGPTEPRFLAVTRRLLAALRSRRRRQRGLVSMGHAQCFWKIGSAKVRVWLGPSLTSRCA